MEEIKSERTSQFNHYMELKSRLGHMSNEMTIQQTSTKNSKIPKIVAITCIWEEDRMLPLALESTKDDVFLYMIIAKGMTEPIRRLIKECQRKWSLNIRLVENDTMKLADARLWAINETRQIADFFLILDGDEIYYSQDSPYSISNIVSQMKPDDFMISSRIVIIQDDFRFFKFIAPPHICIIRNIYNYDYSVTKAPGDQFKLNDLEITIPCNEGIPEDIPYIKSKSGKSVWVTEVPFIMKFDCLIKSHKRSFLRKFFMEWHYNGFADKGMTIEQVARLKDPFLSKNPEVSIEEYANQVVPLWFKNDPGLLYNKQNARQYYQAYPKVMQLYMNREKYRGYDPDKDKLI